MVPVPHAIHGFVASEVGVLLHPLAQRAGLVGTSGFNLGRPDDYRVADGGLHREIPSAVFVPTAALVVEVVSPGDETWQKLDFYAAHSVDELLIADSAKRWVTWLVLHAGRYVEAEYSPLLGITTAELAEQIDWPATDPA
jgi:Uma2 family endonuclease